MHVIYVDLETTGLDPKQHQVVEAAWARENGLINRFVPEHTLENAEPMALEVNKYYKRKLHTATQQAWNGSNAATNFFEALQGATVVGSSPSFDIRFLYEVWNEEPWDHRLFDIPLYAAGIFGWEVARGLKRTIDHMNSLGFKIPYPDHTAAGDVHATRELHDALKKMAKIRRFVDDAATAEQILIANNPQASLGVKLQVDEVWRSHKTPRRKRY